MLNFKKRRVTTFVITVLLVASVTGLWALFWQPRSLTKMHGHEMTLAISQFRLVRQALTTRLEPERILTAATEEYLPKFLDFNQTGMCRQCDRFWVTETAEVRRLRVVSYSNTRAEVRAEVITWGHMVDANTHERLRPYEAPLSDIATYIFIRETSSDPWMLKDMADFSSPNLMNPNEVTLDDFLLFDLEITR
jgi:hypothetical protein